ncbi:MAG: thiosulfate sulfurtransferase, partial [Cellvibrionales bacterium]|nr:thiosulfate sulfurtransferase [Cellvibrionales bacterium]
MTDFTRISCQQASEICQLETTQIIDVRDSEAYAEAHIKNAAHIDNSNLMNFVAEANP